LSEGHLMDFKSYNENVVADCAWMLKRQKHRPIWRRF
jgi:hypothetical protein